VKHYIHKVLLEEHSEYFQKALNGPWKEAEDKVVILDDVDCHSCKYVVTPPHCDELADINLVSIFVNWLYTRKLPGLTEAWSEDEFPEDRRWRWRAALEVLSGQSYDHKQTHKCK